MTSQQFRSRPKLEHVDDVDIISFTDGKIGGEKNFIARELIGLTERLGHRPLFLDFGNVGCINSSELGKLISLHKTMKAAGGHLTLVNINPHICEILDRTKLNMFFEARKETLKRETKCLGPSVSDDVLGGSVRA